MGDLIKQYDATRSWFEYANGQAYGANAWAIAAAFGIFIYVMKDAKEWLMVVFGTVAAIFLVVFAGTTAGGWAIERDAAYQNLVQLEAKEQRLIVSQDPRYAPQGSQRTGNFGDRPLKTTIDWLMYSIVLAFAIGGSARWILMAKKERCEPASPTRDDATVDGP